MRDRAAPGPKKKKRVEIRKTKRKKDMLDEIERFPAWYIVTYSQMASSVGF